MMNHVKGLFFKKIHPLLLLFFSALSASSAVNPLLLSQEAAEDEIRPYAHITFLSAAGTTEQLTGRILSETLEKIEIERISEAGVPSGRIALEASRVKEIVRSRTAQQVYEAKVKRLLRTEASAPERAKARLELGLWCLAPHPQNAGAAPAPDQAFGHLLKAAQLDPKLHAAYPPLLDLLAVRRLAREAVADQELEVYFLAEAGGYRHPEISIRLGEVYLEMGLPDQAMKQFGAVLKDGSEPVNASLQQRARRYLAKIFLARGESDKALKLYWPEAGDAGKPEAFEKYYRSAWFLLSRGRAADRSQARAFLEEARKLQPDYPGVPLQLSALDFVEGKLQSAENRLKHNASLAPDSPDYACALGFVLLERGKFKNAEEQLRKTLTLLEAKAGKGAGAPGLGILGDDESIAPCQAHLGLGLLFEYRGNAPVAAEEYRQAQEIARQAWPLGTPVPTFLMARALLQSKEADKARKILEDLIKSQPDDPGVLAAFSRSLADVEIAGGSEHQAYRLLDQGTYLENGDPFLQRKLGVLLLRKGQLDGAFPYLSLAREAGVDQPETWCALGYYHYRKNELDEAEKAFKKVLALVPRPPKPSKDEPPPPVPPARLYAERGLALVTDARTLEVWEDNFERDTGEEIHRGWLKYENFGIRITLKNGQIVFAGTQENAADGVTKLYREMDARDVVRVSARLRFDQGAAGGRVRAGIRIETTERDVGAGLVFFRDVDGALKASVKTTRSNWEDLMPSPEKDPSQGKLVYAAEKKWPDDGAFHTLMIREADPAAKGKGYDLLFDGEPAAWNVQVGGLGRAAKVLNVGISGQTDALGTAYRFEADDFRVFREKAQEERRGRR
ncbi:MAG: tetratricopeptide repeat protein [Planctomycetes bacterium]|nr:tetratricopeptide repeat protein [Planctomycetota bacterium]